MTQDLKLQNPVSGIISLMYHRVEIIDTNPWDICVSPQNFEKQIIALKKNFKVISLGEVVTGITSGEYQKNSVCITFDDGYADNCFAAKRILEKYNCPATFFIATDFINQTKSFWWDELEFVFLHLKYLPPELNLKIGDLKVNYLLKDNELTQQQWLLHKKWKWHQVPPTKRCEIFLAIWKKLTMLSYQSIINTINAIKQWSSFDKINKSCRLPMSCLQLEELSGNHLFTLALHTHTHCDLSQQKKEIQHEEISNCKNFLQDKFNVASGYLSYPFGRFNAETLEVVKELNLKACFTTKAVQVNKGSNKFLLGRYQPFNWNEITFKKKLDDWFTIAAGNLI